MILNGYRLTGDDVSKARDLADVCDGETLNDARLSARDRGDDRLVAIYTLACAFCEDDE